MLAFVFILKLVAALALHDAQWAKFVLMLIEIWLFELFQTEPALFLPVGALVDMLFRLAHPQFFSTGRVGASDQVAVAGLLV